MFHPAIETFLEMDDRKLVVVCVEIKEQLGLTSRRLRVGEIREAYEKIVDHEVSEDLSDMEIPTDESDYQF